MLSSNCIFAFAALLTTSGGLSLDDNWLEIINEYRAKAGRPPLQACGSAEQTAVQTSVEYDRVNGPHAYIIDNCPGWMRECQNELVCPDGQIPTDPKGAGSQCQTGGCGDTMHWETGQVDQDPTTATGGVASWFLEGPGEDVMAHGHYNTLMSDATCVSCYATQDDPSVPQCGGQPGMYGNCDFCKNPTRSTTTAAPTPAPTTTAAPTPAPTTTAAPTPAPTTTAAPTPAPTTTAAPTPAPTTTAAPTPAPTPAPHHDCDEKQPGCGQKMIWVPNCIGAGCLANGKEQDCAWCVYDLGKCEAHYGSACDDVQKARERQGASCGKEMSV